MKKYMGKHSPAWVRLVIVATVMGVLVIFGDAGLSRAGLGITQSLQSNRDRLMADWAWRRGYGGDVCRAWNNLSPSAKGAFLTITHRLQITTVTRTGRPALDHITALYSIMGAKGGSCGGGDYSRLFMSMDYNLWYAQWLTVVGVKGQLVNVWGNEDWQKSEDIAGPHDPFTHSLQTTYGSPRGQTHFFHAPSTGGWVCRPGAGVCMGDPYMVEMDQDYNWIHDSNTECWYGSRTGRIMYAENHYAIPNVRGGVDYEYMPSVCAPTANPRNNPSYEGCFTDESNRALPVLLAGLGETVESCVVRAAMAGFQYAGVQYFGECWAGDSLGHNRVADSECNTPCDANARELCGGEWRNSIYRTGIKPKTHYMGCFTDAENRALPVNLSMGGETVESCVQKAAAAGYAYAGVQWYGECWAGNTARYLRVSDSECDTPCRANATERCGGGYRNSVYRTGAGPSNNGGSGNNGGNSAPVDSRDLEAEQALRPWESMESSDGRFSLTYQGDGNLVLSQKGVGPLWASNTGGTSAGGTVMQGDGNLVIYDGSNRAVWASGTAGNPGAHLHVQPDGNVVIYSSGHSPLWSTGTCCR